MKKKIAAFLMILFMSLTYGVYWAFFDMNRLSKGDLIGENRSPDGKYTIKAYLSGGGATTDFAVLGELIYNTANKKPKNIYWNYHEDTAEIQWIDNDTVVINGHQLDVLRDIFDFRRKKQ